jgi:Domain of unknown function (DUF3471)
LDAEAPKPHLAIKLDAKLLDAYVGQYEFPLENYMNFGTKLTMTIWRQGDLLRVQFADKNKSYGTFDIYAESETTFFETGSPRQYTFLKNDEAVTAVILDPGQGLPDTEGKKLKSE